MRDEELDAKINNAFPVFVYCNAVRNAALGLDGIWSGQIDLVAAEKNLRLLGRDILEFLSMEFPFKGADWSRRISGRKLYPFWEQLEWARRREHGYQQMSSLPK